MKLTWKDDNEKSFVPNGHIYQITERGIERCEAEVYNAELGPMFAAAPEMLEALEKLMLRFPEYRRMIQNDQTPNYREQAKEYEDMARAAIAKAKGE